MIDTTPREAEFPITMRNYAIMELTKYESSGAASTARSMVTQRWRSCDMSTIRIPLNSRKYPGLYALIDEADYELVSQYSWHPKPSEAGGMYAAATDRSSGKKATLRMHRLIMEAASCLEVDHIDGDGLNNRRDNLRMATKSENQANRSRKSNAVKPATSRFKGVHRRSVERGTGRNWEAKCVGDGVSVHLGVFKTEIEAALAYDEAARSMHGEFAVLNFPRPGERGYIQEKLS